MPPQPAFVTTTARQGPVKLPGEKDTPAECKALPADKQDACKAQALLTAVRRSELKAHRALRGAVTHHGRVTKQYNAGAPK